MRSFVLGFLGLRLCVVNQRWWSGTKQSFQKLVSWVSWILRNIFRNHQDRGTFGIIHAYLRVLLSFMEQRLFEIIISFLNIFYFDQYFLKFACITFLSLKVLAKKSVFEFVETTALLRNILNFQFRILGKLSTFRNSGNLKCLKRTIRFGGLSELRGPLS